MTPSLLSASWRDGAEMVKGAIQRLVLAAIRGHQTYADTGPSDSGRTITDEFGQCKCVACKIARALRIGFAECARQRSEAGAEQVARVETLDREEYERQRATHPEWDEVPF